MSFSKISDVAMSTHGVIGMDDTPNLSVLEMQRKFDELATDVLRPAHDKLVDELEASSAAASIGSTSGTVQSDLTNLLGQAHTHTNKSTIDKFSVDSNNKLLYDNQPISTSSESFKTVSVNGTSIVASTEDTLKFVNGDNVTMSADTTTKTIKINSTAGDKGEKGDPGASVEVSVQPKIDGVSTVQFINSDTKEVMGYISVNDGEDGADGENGNSLTATSARNVANNGTVVTIKDAETEETINTFEVPDGKAGVDGSILSTWKGDWNSSTEYSAGDVVFKNGSYLALQDNVNEFPVTAITYWKPLCESGDSYALISTHYCLSDTATQPTSGWKTQMPTLVKGKYLWVKNTVRKTTKGYFTTDSEEYFVSYIGTDGTPGTVLTASHEKSGKNTTVTISNATTGAEIDSFVVSDGADGTGAGDMTTAVYDTNNDGVVNEADTLSGLSATVTELNALDGITENVQTQLNGKLATTDISDWAKSSTKPTYTASEVGALPSDTPIPTSLSGLSDDASHRTVTDTEKATWNAKLDSSAISNMQTTTNLVTSLSASSDDTHYPSAKTVYDALQSSGGTSIDDTTTASDKTWSSNKINTELAKKPSVWEGTSAEYEAQKNSIPNDTYISIVDDSVNAAIFDNTTLSDTKTWTSRKIFSLMTMRLCGTTVEIKSIPSSQVSCVFQDDSITTDSIIDVYDSIFGFSVTNITVETGKCTVTFPAQSTSHDMRIVVIG